LEFSAKKVVSFRKLGSYEGNSLISKTIQVRIPELMKQAGLLPVKRWM